MDSGRLVEIAGAGPAGLSAAIAVVKAGGIARIYERRRDVGMRFHGDFQGIENWTTETDVLEELESVGIQANFEHTPFNEVTCFGPDGRGKQFHSKKPLFYLIQRGRGEGCLDSSLKKQTLSLGVDICFESSAKRFPQGGIVTMGPHRADAIAVGYLFKTEMENGAYVAISEQLAPKGYAYLLICNGQATIASCLFDDFHNEHQYLERSVEFFTNKLGFKMNKPRHFGGNGNFSLPKTARKGNILYAGEAAGFQDPLFGFGIRSALLTGASAGRASMLNQPEMYEHYWKQRVRPFYRSASTNRWLYNRLGNKGYTFVLKRYSNGRDVREFLQRAYAPKLWKSGWYYLTHWNKRDSLLTLREGCTCTWCKHKRKNIS